MISSNSYQVGVACHSGSERIIHGLRKCIDDHWDDDDFVVFKVDIRNAFNLVSRLAILVECATFFQKSYPGLFGFTEPTPFSGISMFNYALNWVCSRETLWDLCSSLLFRNLQLVLTLIMSALTSSFILGTWMMGS